MDPGGVPFQETVLNIGAPVELKPVTACPARALPYHWKKDPIIGQIDTQFPFQ